MTLMKTETVSLEASVFTCDMESLRQPERNPDKYDTNTELRDAFAGFGFRVNIYKHLVKNPNPTNDTWEDSYMYEYGLAVQEAVGPNESADITLLMDGDRLALLGWRNAVKLTK